MSKPELCGCATCLASRSTTTIPSPRDLGAAIREQRADTPEQKQLRVVAALKATPVEGEKK